MVVVSRDVRIDKKSTREFRKAIDKAGLNQYIGFQDYRGPVISCDHNDCTEFEIGENGYLFTDTSFNDFAKILGINVQGMTLRNSRYASRVFTLSSNDGNNFQLRESLGIDHFLFELQLNECNNPLDEEMDDEGVIYADERAYMRNPAEDHPLVEVIEDAFGFRPQSYLTVANERFGFKHPLISQFTNQLERYCVVNARDSKNQIYCVKRTK